MENKKYSIVSLENDSVEEIFDYVDIEREEKMLARRRCPKLSLIPLVFIISITLMTLSVLHDVNAEVVPDELDELDLLCPPGMSWATTKARCIVNKGFTCCPTCSHEYRCSKSEGEKKCCHLLGIMPSSYKLNCRPGWVWVEWGDERRA